MFSAFLGVKKVRYMDLELLLTLLYQKPAEKQYNFKIPAAGFASLTFPFFLHKVFIKTFGKAV